MTFAEMTTIEPQLDELMNEAKEGVPWSSIEPKLARLVGWKRPDKHRSLKTDAAYNTAADTLYEACT